MVLRAKYTPPPHPQGSVIRNNTLFHEVFRVYRVFIKFPNFSYSLLKLDIKKTLILLRKLETSVRILTYVSLLRYSGIDYRLNLKTVLLLYGSL